MNKDNQDEENKEVVEVIDRLEKLRPEQQEQVITTMEMYNGPIPHPDILAGYEKLDPGAASKIIANGVEESNHRRGMEKKFFKYTARNFYFRFTLAFILALVFGYGSYLLILNGNTIIGSVFAGVTLLSMIGTFTGSGNGSNTSNKSDEDKDEGIQ